MIIFLYGPDTYRSRQKLNEIIASYKKVHKSGLNLKYFDFEKSKTSIELSRKSFQEFQDEIKSTSMFKEKKLVVLKNTFSDENFKVNFLKFSKRFIDSPDIFLFYEKKEVPDDEFFKFLKKYAKSQEFKLLEGQRLKNWLKREVAEISSHLPLRSVKPSSEFENYGAPHQNKFARGQAKIEPKALELLIASVGNNLWQMSNEIKKLISFKKGKKIEVEDVELLVRPKIETDIFKTIDAISSKNKKQALELIHKHLEKGDSPLYLLTMINFQFRNLLIIKEMIEENKPYSQILRQSKLHPLIVKKSYLQAKKFTFEELKKIYQKIFQVDLSIKTGKINPETGLDILIAEI